MFPDRHLGSIFASRSQREQQPINFRRGRPGDGFVLKDALNSELPVYSVRERSGSRQLVQWDIFGARLVPVDDYWEIAGSGYTFATQGHELVQDIRKARDEIAAAFPADDEPNKPLAVIKVLGLTALMVGSGVLMQRTEAGRDWISSRKSV